MHPYPVTFEVDYVERRSRLSALFSSARQAWSIYPHNEGKSTTGRDRGRL